ncbi:hypothetical protein F5146DRAFT_1000180 [Armillaria mellea]|nr:hypothetical protein F5146DRAFT_1000180 [Armillaria mellea]
MFCGKVPMCLLLVGSTSPSWSTLRQTHFTPIAEESTFTFMLEAQAHIMTKEFNRTGVFCWDSVLDTCISVGWEYIPTLTFSTLRIRGLDGKEEELLCNDDDCFVATDALVWTRIMRCIVHNASKHKQIACLRGFSGTPREKQEVIMISNKQAMQISI